MQEFRYPVGEFVFSPGANPHQISAWIDEIAEAPQKLRDAMQGLSDIQLETPYRDGGWTVRQVIHHLPDSHLNSYVRFRLALTEEMPVIKPYQEDRWAELLDARTAPAELSLALLDAVHQRWVILLRSLTAADLQRSFQHPELGTVSLEKNIALYAWHGRHHVAHITSLRERLGWR